MTRKEQANKLMELAGEALLNNDYVGWQFLFKASNELELLVGPQGYDFEFQNDEIKASIRRALR